MMGMDKVVVLMTFCVARMLWAADVDGGERRGLESYSSEKKKDGASDVSCLIPWFYDFAIACDFWSARVYVFAFRDVFRCMYWCGFWSRCFAYSRVVG